ncbi:probable ATP-dependent RNA helicase DDX60 isoform X2 [Sorex fumeus]|uniref:probable ATP-dependent RNA helicase DDX60 isoform X2 n=1 Tax=Sorex fumeus TaxID=62283 RepID=UPI0024ADF9D2|nr:probable ATP-dependent RNA helicase DDX60 isoform X2 [Sorex fumeus]
MNKQATRSKEYMIVFKEIENLILNQMPRAEYTSLFNDFIESEFFLIDGDSLLITCVCDISLKPGQTLHFFYLVEHYLADLIGKGGQFAIVFFKEAEYAYLKFPELLSLRTALILHLECNTTLDVQTNISGCLSREWTTYLGDRDPYFVIVADQGINNEQTNLFNFLIIQSWIMNINAVLSSGQESNVLRLYAYFMPSNLFARKFYYENRKKITGAYKTLIKKLQSFRDLTSQSVFKSFKWEDMMNEAYGTISLLTELWPEGSDIRRVLCVTACSLSLKMYQHFLESRKKTPPDHKTEKKVQSNCATLQEVEDLCKLHCLSVVLQLHLPLSQRACGRVITSCWNKSILTFLRMKRWCEYFILSNINKFDFWNLNLTHLSDLSDDLLLKNIAFYYENESVEDLHSNLGHVIMKDYENLWNTVSKLVIQFDVGKPSPLRTTHLPFLQKEPLAVMGKISEEKMPNLGFIPVSSELVDNFVGDLLKDFPFLKRDDPIVTSLVKQKEFDELLHWHSLRPLSDDYDRTKSSIPENPNDLYYLRSYQKYIVFQRFYGSSLESAPSKLIITETAKKRNFGSPKSKKAHTKAEIITRENEKRLFAKKEQKEEQKWNVLSVSIEEEMKKNLNSGIQNLEDFLKSCESNSVKFRAEMAGLTTCFREWKEHCKGEGKIKKDLNIAVQMMRRIHSLLEKYPELLHKEDQKLIARCLKYLGFNELSSFLCPPQVTGDNIKEKKKSKYSVGIGPVLFQLQHMGHYLIRNERKDPDPRVQNFIPDTWQRELLDIVDNNESAVIVAPTSSGKTYASYYCMEKVLKESDEGVVVYVAPTKALVNQVAATVFHRFTKNMPSGEVLCGVFTRDYRHDALNCQVLITVPACLEILLLSPHRQKWAKRIRYVIFDEVHCLGGEIGAEIWEHLLVMIRCPFLALSATISNPEHLTEWLRSVKLYWKEVDSKVGKGTISKKCTGSRASSHKDDVRVRQSYNVKLVIYGERYNDLEKHICSIKDDDIHFDHFHPCAAITTEHIEMHGFPSDFTLSPREGLQLYDTMFESWRSWPRAKELCPENFIHFKNKIVIKKMDFRKYEESLKEELTSWIKNGNTKEAKLVLRKLRPPSVLNSTNSLENFPLFIEKLREMDKLPAVVFMFRLDFVEDSANELREYLEKKQEEKCSPKADKEVYDVTNKLQKVKKSIEKQKAIEERSKKKPREMNQSFIREAQHNNLLKILEKNLAIPQDCTYADQKASVDTEVVTATGTLALGINMPCKSVVFAHNSIYLDALNYRQMSGRAGRRGQDLHGDVFFLNIPFSKIEKLIKSKVPELKGQFPFNISLVLRLMLLTSRGDDPEDAKAKVLSVLKHPLITFKKPKFQNMLKLYFLFSLQFLVKEGYLDQEGNPMGFAGLVSHLHYHEPSNLVFVHFLVRGLFHNLCQPTIKGTKSFSQDIMEKLVLVLCHLFGRHYLPAKFREGDHKFFQSKVFLEDLPEDFNAALEEYNNNVTKDFASFLLIVSTLADMKQEYQLPLSKIDFSGKECDDSQLVSHLMNCKEGKVAISPFVCLSGNTDSVLLQPATSDNVILRTVNISYSQAPILKKHKFDNQGRLMPLNSYALDFYKHGSLKGLAQDNGLNEGDAYLLLKDFMLTIESISVSLRELCEDEEDSVVLAFEQLSETYAEKFNKV